MTSRVVSCGTCQLLLVVVQRGDNTMTTLCQYRRSGVMDAIMWRCPRKDTDHLQRRSAHRRKVLDMGCGTGISSCQLADHGFHVTGCDIDGRMVNQALL